MWTYYHQVTNYFAGLSSQEWMLLMILVVGIGLFCLRGFGSRSNY